MINILAVLFKMKLFAQVNTFTVDKKWFKIHIKQDTHQQVKLNWIYLHNSYNAMKIKAWLLILLIVGWRFCKKSDISIAKVNKLQTYNYLTNQTSIKKADANILWGWMVIQAFHISSLKLRILWPYIAMTVKSSSTSADILHHKELPEIRIPIMKHLYDVMFLIKGTRPITANSKATSN